MSTKEYDAAEKELSRLIQLNKNLSETNTRLIEGKEVLETLSKDLEGAITTNILIIREYLKDLIEVRMTFAREVADILRTTTELRGITKSTKEIVELGSSLEKLKSVLTPEFVETLKKVIKVDNA